MKTMPRQRFTLRELCLMTFLAVFGMLFKPLVSPAFNLITDFVRVPGGSMTAGFSLLFLVFAAARIRKPGTALLMGLVQAAMSLSMGISATAGIQKRVGLANTAASRESEASGCVKTMNK